MTRQPDRSRPYVWAGLILACLAIWGYIVAVLVGALIGAIH